MTTEDRLDRLEHWTAALVEERRKDREEYKSLWRDAQAQIRENNRQIADLGIRIRDLAEESREADRRLEVKIDALSDRIEHLVSAFGQLIAEVRR